jgi:hypothetical protein
MKEILIYNCIKQLTERSKSSKWRSFDFYNLKAGFTKIVFSEVKMLTNIIIAKSILIYFQIGAIHTICISQKAVKAWIIANALHFSLIILRSNLRFSSKRLF